jgi:hypothetical protein
VDGVRTYFVNLQDNKYAIAGKDIFIVENNSAILFSRELQQEVICPLLIQSAKKHLAIKK